MLNIEFLTNCLNNDVIPQFLEFKTTNKMLRKSSSYHQCQVLLLNQEIVNQTDHLNRLKAKFRQIAKFSERKVNNGGLYSCTVNYFRCN